MNGRVDILWRSFEKNAKKLKIKSRNGKTSLLVNLSENIPQIYFFLGPVTSILFFLQFSLKCAADFIDPSDFKLASKFQNISIGNFKTSWSSCLLLDSARGRGFLSKPQRNYNCNFFGKPLFPDRLLVLIPGCGGFATIFLVSIHNCNPYICQLSDCQLTELQLSIIMQPHEMTTIQLFHSHKM